MSVKVQPAFAAWSPGPWRVCPGVESGSHFVNSLVEVAYWGMIWLCKFPLGFPVICHGVPGFLAICSLIIPHFFPLPWLFFSSTCVFQTGEMPSGRVSTLLQRTRIWFPAHISGGSQLPEAPASGDQIFFVASEAT